MKMAKIAWGVEGEQLSRRLYYGSQSWLYESVWKMDRNGEGAYKIRVRIRRNAYDFQSWMIGEVWSHTDLKWNKVTELPIEGAACASVTYVDDHLTQQQKDLFVKDEQTVLAEVAKVLF